MSKPSLCDLPLRNGLSIAARRGSSPASVLAETEKKPAQFALAKMSSPVLDSDGLNLIDRVPDTSSVNQQDRNSVYANRLRQSVASRTWNLGYDRPAAS